MAITIITANDIHISDKGPRSRIDDFKHTVLDKLAQMSTACSKLGADAAVIAGDLFNNKEPARNSHELNKDLVRVFNTFPCPIYMIEGNHDMKANRLDSIESQPLGVLFEDGTLKRLRHEVLERDGTKVSLVGIPYREDLEPSMVEIPDRGDCHTQICVMHIYAGLHPGKLFNERLWGYDELAKLGPDVFVLGHYHVDQGVYDNEGRIFVNIGSMTRGTLSEENIDHTPQIGFITVTEDEHGNPVRTARPIRLRFKPASEVFDLEKREEEERESTAIREFVEKLASEAVKTDTDSIQDIDEVIDRLGLAKVVRDRAMHYIHMAGVGK